MGWTYFIPNNPYLSDILNNDDPSIHDTTCIHTNFGEPVVYWEV